jgi:hypothetical protein
MEPQVLQRRTFQNYRELPFFVNVDILENRGESHLLTQLINPYPVWISDSAAQFRLIVSQPFPAAKHPLAHTRQPCTFRGKTHAQARAAIQLNKDQFLG